MQNAWQSFLTQTGAVIEAGGVRHFGHPQAETEAAAGKNIIADLSHFSLIRARGADAENFLQAQLSNDIQSLKETSRLAAYCNAQGRALAIFRVFKSTDSFLLQLHRSLLEPTLKRLRMFVLRAQVVLESADEELARIGLSGPDTPRLLQDLSLAPPEKPNDCRTQNDLTLVRLPGISPRFEIIGAYPAIQNLWLRLQPLPMNLRPEAAPTSPIHEPAVGGRTDFPSATDPFVALPPASMQSSPTGRGWPEGPGEGEGDPKGQVRERPPVHGVQFVATARPGGLTPVGASAWAWLDIMAGIPTLFPPTVEAFVPQMTNLDLIGGISFEKGCYPGQEIIARTHYRGRLKQRMYRGHVQNPVPPQPGDALYAPNLPGQTVGTIVDAQPSPHGGYDLLAVIQISSVEQAELHLENIAGARVKIEDLPYPLGIEARRQPV